MLRDPKELWSKYGILSLSKSDAYFGTGEDYWKGAIWISIYEFSYNFRNLACRCKLFDTIKPS